MTFDEIMKRAKEGKPLVQPGDNAPPPGGGGTLDLSALTPVIEAWLAFTERQTLALEAIGAFVLEMKAERDQAHAAEVARLAAEAKEKADAAAKAAEWEKLRLAAEKKAQEEAELAELEQLTRPDAPVVLLVTTPAAHGIGG